MSEQPVETHDSAVPAGGGRRRKGRSPLAGCLAVLVVLALVVGLFWFALTRGVDWVSDTLGESPDDYPGPGRGGAAAAARPGGPPAAGGGPPGRAPPPPRAGGGGGAGPAEQRGVERPREVAGEDRQHVDAHQTVSASSSSSPGTARTTTAPARTSIRSATSGMRTSPPSVRAPTP
jgi:hypothetical protein